MEKKVQLVQSHATVLTYSRMTVTYTHETSVKNDLTAELEVIETHNANLHRVTISQFLFTRPCCVSAVN